MPDQPRGLVLAAPHSGAGKTSLAAGLLGALKQSGVAVAAAKCGPDYIDPTLHHAVLGRSSINLDPWAMNAATLRALATRQAASHDLLVIEGVMGLFDGSADGRGSTADLAATLRLPVVLIIDSARQAQSVAALAEGFIRHREDVNVAGIILNRLGSSRHERMLRDAMKPVGIPVLGAVARDDRFTLPGRHLGLIPAPELADLETRLSALAQTVARTVLLDDLQALAAPIAPASAPANLLPPPAQRLAVARDTAFCFMYPHLLQHWRQAGAQITYFPPLDNARPDPAAGLLLLPGGHPALPAGRLAATESYPGRLATAARPGVPVPRDCSGQLAPGAALPAADGTAHRMAGLLPVETSFAARRLHLGYRRLRQAGHLPWPTALVGHEFHYASVIREGDGMPLFQATDALGESLPDMGRVSGTVSGSFAHVIGPA